MATRKQIIKEDVTRLLVQISEYVGHLARLEQQVDPLQTLPQYAFKEQEIQRVYSKQIVSWVSIPLPIQALIVEENRLVEEIHNVCKKGDINRNELKSLFVRRFIVNLKVVNWIQKEKQKEREKIKATQGWVVTSYKQLEVVIGDNWKLLFVGTSTLQLPHHKSPKPK